MVPVWNTGCFHTKKRRRPQGHLNRTVRFVLFVSLIQWFQVGFTKVRGFWCFILLVNIKMSQVVLMGVKTSLTQLLEVDSVWSYMGKHRKKARRSKTRLSRPSRGSSPTFRMPLPKAKVCCHVAWCCNMFQLRMVETVSQLLSCEVLSRSPCCVCWCQSRPTGCSAGCCNQRAVVWSEDLEAGSWLISGYDHVISRFLPKISKKQNCLVNFTHLINATLYDGHIWMVKTLQAFQCFSSYFLVLRLSQTFSFLKSFNLSSPKRSTSPNLPFLHP